MQMMCEEYYEAIEYFQEQYSGLKDYSYLRSHEPELIECYRDGRSIAEFDELAHFNDLIDMKVHFSTYEKVSKQFAGHIFDFQSVNDEIVQEMKSLASKLERSKQSNRDER